MIPEFDIVVIGAGPAGMAAATCSVAHGASVCLLDEQPQAGGQIYRNVGGVTPARARILGADYLEGAELVRGLVDVEHVSGATVWKVDEDGTVTYSAGGHARQIRGRHVIIASGAMERPVPLEGWTLPGVMTAGAAQILMKNEGQVAQNAVLVGSGPLLYLVATQLLAAGAPPKALVETQTRAGLRNALPHLWGALGDWRQLAKGVRFLAALTWAGVPRYVGATDVTIEGDGAAQAVRFRAGGKVRHIETDLVLLHQGGVPNTQISRALGIEYRFNDVQRCFHPVLDHWGQTSKPVFSIAGDGAGIGGAKVAAVSGQIAALNALVRVGLMDAAKRDALAAPLLKAREAALLIRPFLDALFAPPQEVLTPSDDTIICRCEEVRAGDIRRFAAMGCTGPNRTKVFSRCGMGPCQGRNCGLAVTEILAAEHGLTQDEVGSFRIRAPLKPVTLGELAGLAEER